MVRNMPYFHVISPLSFTNSANQIVNELSNTIDLSSTLLRAQALFRRFQRTVDAIDKKHNFPAPPTRQRKATDTPTASGDKPSPDQKRGVTTNVIGTGAAKSSSGNAASGSSNAAAKARARVATERDKETQQAKEKVISPELRALLSRKVVVLIKETAVEGGGGGVG